MDLPVRRLVLPAFAGYCLLAVVQTWPLSLCLTTHLTGIPGGDTGVYVWNTWVFRYELAHHRWPFSTSMLLPLAGPASLGLHNYTAVANLLTVPLQPWLGVVGAFNVVFMLGIALSGLGLFVLAYHVTGRAWPSWIAGAMFAASPFLVARGTAHFSLAAAAPLPFFLYWFDRTWQHRRMRDAMLAGACVAWAAYSDPYYAIYCAMLAATVAAVRVIEVVPAGRHERTAVARRVVDALLASVLALMTIVYGLSGGRLEVGPLAISMHTLYTPMLLFAVLVVARVLLTRRFAVRWHPLPSGIWIAAAAMAASAAVLMAPELYALGQLAADSRFVRAPVLWRSSAPGADLLAFLLPNPNHRLAPAWLVDWVARQPGRFEENVLSISWVALAAIVAARRWAGLRVDGLWLVITIGFGLLALGPFLLIAGHRTFVPTPWTFLRYVPVIGDARMPQRFGVLMFLGFSVIFAQALIALTRHWPARRRLVVGVVSAALLLELLPAPRPLYAAAVPSVYRTIANDSRPVSVLEVPFGLRDGLSSLGNFGPGSQLFQTVHQKPIIGGYLSRIDERTKAIYEAQPLLAVLIAYSEQRQPSAEDLARAAASARAFATNARLGYVVIDRDRIPADARHFLIAALSLGRVEEDGALELYLLR